MGLFGSGESRGLGRVDSIIGPEASLRGNYNSKNSVHVDGEVYGNLICEEGIIVGEKGMIRGNLVGKTILVGGKVKGNITASLRVEIQETAHVEGDITTARLIIEEGALFEGSCQMEEASKVIDLPKAARD